MGITPKRRAILKTLMLGAGILSGVWAQSPSSSLRVISLSPSLTDMVVDLGRGRWVVGVTRYDHNPAVSHAKSVGGWIDPSLTQIIALQPDLVLMVKAQEPFLGPNLRKLGVPYKALPAQTLNDILTALDSLGRWLDCANTARHLKDSLAHFLAPPQMPDSTWPTALFIVDHTPGTLQNLYAAGGQTYLHELLTLVGLRNVCASYSGYLSLSLEQVVAWDPDVILEMAQGTTSTSQAPWDQLPELRAVQRHWIFIVDPELFSHPSTRFPQALARLKAIRASLYADR